MDTLVANRPVKKTTADRIRVLHVVENFNGQAVESWLTRLVCFERFDFDKFQFEFFLIGTGHGSRANVVVDKGCHLVSGNSGMAGLLEMAKALRKQVSQQRYDIVHIHQDVLAGVFALALLGTGTRVVTHVHNCWQRLPVGGRIKQQVLTAIARRLTLQLSTAVVGVSKAALKAITKNHKSARRIDRVIYCSTKHLGPALDTRESANVRADVRNHYQLPADAKLLVFIGRLDSYKNPLFALNVLSHMIGKGNSDAHLIVAGVGGLTQQLNEEVTRCGLQDRVRIVGWIDDPGTLLRACDLLLIPSQEWCSEGLGLVAVEAQGCGVPVLGSLSIPEDAAIVPELFKRVSLSSGIETWAREAEKLIEQAKTSEPEARLLLEQSAFTDAASYSAIAELYEVVLKRALDNAHPRG